jgi:hypothetical protein
MTLRRVQEMTDRRVAAANALCGRNRGATLRRKQWRGGDEMPALIRYLCVAEHERHDESAITLFEASKRTAGTRAGATGHEWRQITPTLIGELQQLGPIAMSRLVVR